MVPDRDPDHHTLVGPQTDHIAHVAALAIEMGRQEKIIERYTHKTKRCCMVSEDDATSSSDRRVAGGRIACALGRRPKVETAGESRSVLREVAY